MGEYIESNAWLDTSEIHSLHSCDCGHDLTLDEDFALVQWQS